MVCAPWNVPQLTTCTKARRIWPGFVISPIGSMLAMLTCRLPSHVVADRGATGHMLCMTRSFLVRRRLPQVHRIVVARCSDSRPPTGVRVEVYQGLCAGGVCCGCCEGFYLGGDVADVLKREGQGQGVGDGVDVVQAGGEEELPGKELGDGPVDHVRVPERVLLPRGLVVGHQVGDFFA
jgi:hypothetical protein